MLTIGLIVAGLGAANAQGLIKLYNASTSYAISTNGGPMGTVGGIGRTASGAGAANMYYYALLISPTAPTSTDPLVGGMTQALMNSDGITPVTGTNFTLAAGGIVGPGALSAYGVAIANWDFGTMQYVQIVGWSANLGPNWSHVVNELTTLSFDSPVLVTGGYYYGYSNVGQVTSNLLGPPEGVAATVFNAGGISAGFDLNYVTIPEPSTIVLAGLGGLSLLLFRRRK